MPPAAARPLPLCLLLAATLAPRARVQDEPGAPGLEVELVAAEPDLCNAVCLHVDERGRFWVVETFRIQDGAFDTRDHMEWKDEDLACRTVADRLAMFERHLADKIPRYRAFPERIRLLEDRDGDGVVDASAVFADSFRDLADGIAAGVLVHGGDVWLTNIPKLWRLRDRDGDGRADEQVAVHDGFGVHVSLIGHDMHGLIVGPDRRLYFSIGDRGFHVETKEGAVLAYPHEGAVLRCELDGSRLEVIHRGLRNPQELAFDDRGDLFTGDNNSDGGDRARFVFVAEGGDSGWRIGHQWLDDRGRWKREQMWLPPHPGQPAWIVPPIANVGDGPSGLLFDTGTGMPARYRGHFFLCDFRGGSANSGVRALSLVPKGAGFELASMQQPIWRVLCTDVDVGPDGSLYVLDWVDSWTKTGKGRIYRLRAPGARDDLRLRTLAQDLAADFTGLPDTRLLVLLGHDDRRIRQKAQFALVDQGAREALALAANDPDRRPARLHAIWGLGILGRSDPAAAQPCVELLRDGDAEVRAQAAKVLGEVRWPAAQSGIAETTAERLCRMARSDDSSRARYQSALALGRLGPAAAEQGVPAMFELLADCGDRDPWLRHAAVTGLCGLGDRSALHAAVHAEDPAVRLGALLCLRRRQDPELASFLHDPAPALRAEAARAILDADVRDALPALAELLETPREEETSLVWRALNANRVAGTPGCGLRVLAFARDPLREAPMRAEALAILAEWPEPHGQDRVVGDWRPVAHPDHRRVVDALAAALPGQILDPAGEVARAAAGAAGRLKLRATAPALLSRVGDRQGPAELREAALEALEVLDVPELDRAVEAIEADAPGSLRETAVRIFARRNPDKAVPLLASLLANGSLREKRGAFAALGDLEGQAAADLALHWLGRLADGGVEPGAQLELLEAAARRSEAAIRERLAARGDVGSDPLSPFRECLEGGSESEGRRLFFRDERARCQRCHSVDGRGGAAGPRLDGIGARVGREHLLESLVQPGAKIAAGYATAVLRLHNGDTVAGVVVQDQDGAVEVMDVDGNATRVPWERIRERGSAPTSAMPPVGTVLSRRELRDLVEFLASLR